VWARRRRGLSRARPAPAGHADSLSPPERSSRVQPALPKLSDVRDLSRSVLRAGSPITRAARRRAPTLGVGAHGFEGSRIESFDTSAHRAFAQAPPPRGGRSQYEPGHRCRPVGRTAEPPVRGFELSTDAKRQSRASPRRGVLPLIRLLSPETRRSSTSRVLTPVGFKPPEGFSAGIESAGRTAFSWMRPKNARRRRIAQRMRGLA
jgi:hypothetical protein